MDRSSTKEFIMWIYILNIILSSLLFIGADIVYRKNKQNYFYIFLLLGIILISSAIAGFRGDTIGTDVLVYAEPLQRLANVTDKFSDYLNNNMFIGVEKGYLALIFLVSRFSNKLFASQLIVEFIILASFIIGIWKFRKFRNIYSYSVICIFIFYCFFYNLSFNMIRQSIAIFILFLSFNYLFQNEYIKYCIGTVIAILFHSSAIIAVPVALIYIMTRDNNEKLTIKYNVSEVSQNSSFFRSLIILLVAATLLLIPKSWGEILHLAGLDIYTSRYMSMFSLHLSYSNLGIRLLLLSVLLIEWNNMSANKNKLRYFYLVTAVLDIFLFSFSGYIIRIGWYTTSIYMYSIPDALGYESKDKKIILTLILIIGLMGYWYFYNVMVGYNDTVPYIFGNFN